MMPWASDGWWVRVPKFDSIAASLADRHYSRRTIGSNQFMPPGQTVVLVGKDGRSVFGWWRPDPASGITAMNGLDGWTCTIFRNESDRLSSELVLEAEVALVETGVNCGPDGLITYVWDAKVRSSNPGFCFLKAGWHRTGRSADGRKTLLQKPFELAGRLPAADSTADIIRPGEHEQITRRAATGDMDVVAPAAQADPPDPRS